MNEFNRVIEDDKNCAEKNNWRRGKKRTRLSQQVITRANILWDIRFLLFFEKFCREETLLFHIFIFLLYIHGWHYVGRDEPFLIYSHLDFNWLCKGIFPSTARLNPRENPVRRQILIKHKMPLFWKSRFIIFSLYITTVAKARERLVKFYRRFLK